MNLSRVSAALCCPRLFREAKAFRAVWSKRSELTETDWGNAVQGLGKGPGTFTYISRAI